MWNKIIAIIQNPFTPLEVVEYGKMILGQYNTAGGKYIMLPMLELFYNENIQYCKTLWINHNGNDLRIVPYNKFQYELYDTPKKDVDRFLKSISFPKRWFELDKDKIILKEI